MNKRFYKFFLIMLFVPLWAISQEQISGLVTDQTTGDPLPGVSIILKGTTKGVSTDFDGNYTISANQNDILQFSYIGYKSIEEKIAGTTLNVSLETDTQLLEEVVLIGYGSAKKKI
ncbi:carboxypeptidase-like regulatory domain-containing protein [Cellulophaga baltica 4]|nr:carboxypeptidase-like regulatory domain-containing protein [Cellulophaga baltica 4]